MPAGTNGGKGAEAYNLHINMMAADLEFLECCVILFPLIGIKYSGIL